MKDCVKIAIHMHEDDNIAVACSNLLVNDKIFVDKKEIIIKDNIELAHKIAFSNIKKGEKILKFGAHIGSAIIDISQGEHVHLHNIKSDYIATSIV